MNEIDENKVKMKELEHEIKQTTDKSEKVALINLLVALQQKENFMMQRASTSTPVLASPVVVDTPLPPTPPSSFSEFMMDVKSHLMSMFYWTDNEDIDPWGSLLRWVTARPSKPSPCTDQGGNCAVVVMPEEQHHRQGGSNSFLPGPSTVDHRRPS
jgi:hypothetical protein